MSIKRLAKGTGFKRASNALGRIDEKLRSVISLDTARINPKKIEAVALKKLRPMIVAALRRNLSRSGIKNKSRDLLRAVSNPLITFQRGRVRIAFPAGLSQKRYTYANALNTGAVRTPRGAAKVDQLGEKAKRTLKRAAFAGRKLNIREQRRFDKGVKQKNKKTGKVTIKNSFDVGGAKIIPAKRFYYISEAEAKRIGKEFARLYRLEVAKLARGKQTRRAS